MAEESKNYVLKIEEIGRDTQGAGRKASRLADLIRMGFNVPQGFVIKANAFEKFLHMNRLESRIRNLLDSLDMNDLKALSETSGHIRELFARAQFPDSVANEMKDEYEELSVGREVKEAGGVALDMIKAGRGHALVSVRVSLHNNGPSNSEVLFNVRNMELPDSIKESWASLFSPHAIFYRKMRGFDAIPKAAVVIQKMLEPEKSGVIITSFPAENSGEDACIIMEATWGFGDILNSGGVVPDEYLLIKETGNIINKKTGKKLYLKRTNAMSGKVEKETVSREQAGAEVLDESETKNLWGIAKKIEEHYNGQPQIIEWCTQRKRTFVMQTMAMKPVKVAENESFSGEGKKTLVSGVPACSGVVDGRVKIVHNPSESQNINKGDIIVTKVPGPGLIPMIGKASAIVSDFGGRACSLAVISREIGIPCITGTETATTILEDGQDIVLDGTRGRIYAHVEPITRPEPPYFAGVQSQAPDMLQQDISKSFGSGQDSIATEIKLSLSFPEPVNTSSSDGVGLLRAEHMLTESGRHPLYIAKNSPEELVQIIAMNIGKVARAYYPKQVWYRTLNARTDKLGELEGMADGVESNPIIGWHGIRRSLDQPDILRCEIEAVKRLYQQGLNNVAIMLPFISRVEELRSGREIIGSVFSENRPNLPALPKLGIIIETPAAALEVESMCREGINFISIDLDNLTQLTLAVDNENPRTSKLYRETDPAVMKLVRHVIGVCKQYRITTSVFGEATNNPDVIEMLVEMGIGSISTEADMFQQIREIVARIERKMLLDRVRKNQNI